MDLKLEGIRRGYWQQRRKPNPIRVVELEDHLRGLWFWSRTRLARAIASHMAGRRGEEYRIAFNSCSLDSWEWKVVYSPSRGYSKLGELVVVDIKILGLEKDRRRVFLDYPWLEEELLSELRRIADG